MYSVPRISQGPPDLKDPVQPLIPLQLLNITHRYPVASGRIRIFPDYNHEEIVIGKMVEVECSLFENIAVDLNHAVDEYEPPELATCNYGSFSGEQLTFLLPNAIPLEMVRIPAGCFKMGAYPGEQGAFSREYPQRRVTLTHDFYIGKFEVTKGQWQAVMDTTPWAGKPGILNELESPAVYLTWQDTQDFIQALNVHIANSNQGSQVFRLPTEAQWEYACRAGTETRFYWGENSSDIHQYAWNLSFGTIVGQKWPNAWGLYDMIGNVYEWCEDPYEGGGYSICPEIDPTGPRYGWSRAVRGGNWFFPNGARSAYRTWEEADYAESFRGFRLAAW